MKVLPSDLTTTTHLYNTHKAPHERGSCRESTRPLAALLYHVFIHSLIFGGSHGTPDAYSPASIHRLATCLFLLSNRCSG